MEEPMKNSDIHKPQKENTNTHNRMEYKIVRILLSRKIFMGGWKEK